MGGVDEQRHATQSVDHHEGPLVPPRLGRRVVAGAGGGVGQGQHLAEPFIGFGAALAGEPERRVEADVVVRGVGQREQPLDGGLAPEHAEREGGCRLERRIVALRGCDHCRRDTSRVGEVSPRRHEIGLEHRERLDSRSGRLGIGCIGDAFHERRRSSGHSEFAEGTAEIDAECLGLLP